MTDKAIAALIKEAFPKHSTAAYSFAKNTKETGVMLCPQAAAIARAAGVASSPVKRTRRKCIQFRARLSPTTAAAVEAKMAKVGISSKQTLVEALLLNWIGGET